MKGDHELLDCYGRPAPKATTSEWQAVAALVALVSVSGILGFASGYAFPRRPAVVTITETEIADCGRIAPGHEFHPHTDTRPRTL